MEAPQNCTLPWFHGALPQTQAEALLHLHGLADGLFLVRENRERQLVLSLVFQILHWISHAALTIQKQYHHVKMQKDIKRKCFYVSGVALPYSSLNACIKSLHQEFTISLGSNKLIPCVLKVAIERRRQGAAPQLFPHGIPNVSAPENTYINMLKWGENDCDDHDYLNEEEQLFAEPLHDAFPRGYAPPRRPDGAPTPAYNASQGFRRSDPSPPPVPASSRRSDPSPSPVPAPGCSDPTRPPSAPVTAPASSGRRPLPKIVSVGDDDLPPSLPPRPRKFSSGAQAPAPGSEDNDYENFVDENGDYENFTDTSSASATLQRGATSDPHRGSSPPLPALPPARGTTPGAAPGSAPRSRGNSSEGSRGPTPVGAARPGAGRGAGLAAGDQLPYEDVGSAPAVGKKMAAIKLEDTLATVSGEAATQLIRSAVKNMQRAENLMAEPLSSPLFNGFYMTRLSPRSPGQIVLSVLCRGEVIHFPLSRSSAMGISLTAVDGCSVTRFSTLEQLLEHFARDTDDVMPCLLTKRAA